MPEMLLKRKVCLSQNGCIYRKSLANGNPNARLEQEGQFFIWGGFYTVECSEHERIIELCNFPDGVNAAQHFICTVLNKGVVRSISRSLECGLIPGFSADDKIPCLYESLLRPFSWDLNIRTE